jgi:hypothetical protein
MNCLPEPADALSPRPAAYMAPIIIFRLPHILPGQPAQGQNHRVSAVDAQQPAPQTLCSIACQITPRFVMQSPHLFCDYRITLAGFRFLQVHCMSDFSTCPAHRSAQTAFQEICFSSSRSTRIAMPMPCSCLGKQRLSELQQLSQ